MQKSTAASTSSTTTQNVSSFFSSSFFGSSSSRSRPGTSSGETATTPSFSSSQPNLVQQQQQQQQQQPNVLTKERKGSFARKSSFSSSPSKRRANSSGAETVVTDTSAPPALPDFALAAAAKLSRETEAVQSPASTDSFSKMLGRTPTPGGGLTPVAAGQWQSEVGGVHANVQDLANKRISTLDYLRKAHEGRLHWFNTFMFEKPDMTRMSAVASQKLARRATNYLLLGLSLPTIIDLNASTPLEFLRSLNILLSEFEAFQQLHGDGAAGSLSRARLPQMFRRGPSKSRRSTSSVATEIGLPMDADQGSGGIGMSPAASASVVSFAASESDLLPGETYSLLLTPSLPFDPDYFETFATLCDVLIDCYKKLLLLIPTPRECTAPVAEQFAKADAKVRKLVVQGTVKEFEENSRNQIRAEVANIGKVVLSGLM